MKDFFLPLDSLRVGGTVNLPNFTCVLASNLKMNISQNTTKSVRILINGKNESSSMGQYLRVSGDTLYSDFTGLLVNANGNIGTVILDIAIPNLRSARTYATGQIIFTTPFKVTDLTVENKNGTGKIIGGDFSGDKLTVIANALDSVKVKVSNINNLNLFVNHLSPLVVTGNAVNTTVDCSSISSYNGFELYSKNLTVTNLSTGKLQVSIVRPINWTKS